MKENKKGFTLIELLAVLVVLAILALIAVPIVLNIINESREKSHYRSVEGFAKAVETEIYSYQMSNTNVSSSSIGIAEQENEDGTKNGEWHITVGGSNTDTGVAIDYSGSRVHGCTLTYESNDSIKLTGCYISSSDENITYENGSAK